MYSYTKYKKMKKEKNTEKIINKILDFLELSEILILENEGVLPNGSYNSQHNKRFRNKKDSKCPFCTKSCGNYHCAYNKQGDKNE